MTSLNLRGRTSVRVVILALVLLSSLACEPGLQSLNLVFHHPFSSDYSIWAPSSIESSAVFKHPAGGLFPNICVVQPMVVAWGWNDEFVIAQNHPTLMWPDRPWEVSAETHWWVVDRRAGQTHEAPDLSEYQALRQRLGVPEALAFTCFLNYDRSTRTWSASGQVPPNPGVQRTSMRRPGRVK